MIIDLILFMGQSNMAGRGISNDRWPESYPNLTPGAGYEFRAVSDPTRLYGITEPFGVKENRIDGINDGDMKTGSMVTAFVNSYYANNGNVPVIGISASKGGSSIAEWQTDKPYYLDTIQRWNDCRNYLIKNDYIIRHQYMVWCQGETDGDIGTSEEWYSAMFHNMLDDIIRKGIEKCFLVQIGRCFSLLSGCI